MEDRPMLSCLQPWDFPKGREKFLFGGIFKVFVLDVFPRPCFQVGAEVEWVSELAKNRGLGSVTSKGPHQQRDSGKENTQRQKIQEAVITRSQVWSVELI